ncbi:MAG TPA: hypothetical protein VN892_03715, partial [Solirubrobacteraceae bacterium]|nr:hypothetical protein [Solirubrobacteraceae bacterium]
MPHWSILSQSEPSHFKAGDVTDAYRLIVRNDGAVHSVEKEKVTVTDVLPSGVSAKEVEARAEGANGTGSPRYQLACVTETVTCTYEESALQGKGPLPPGTTIVMTITVSIAVDVQAPTLENLASVSGGGAPGASVEEFTAVTSQPASFGLSYLTTEATQESGEGDTQAGSHPFELTASLVFTISSREVASEQNGESESPLSSTSVKDLEVELPPGLVGDPSAVPRCGQQEFQAQERLDCPVDTQVGTLTAYFYGTFHSAVSPVYDIVPPPGQPVELGFTIAGIGHVPMFFQVRDDAAGNRDEYRLVARLNDLPEAGPLQGAILTLWGVPEDGTHDLEREGTTGQGRQQPQEFCKPKVEFKSGKEEQILCPSGVAARPFLTLPSSCSGEPLGVGLFTDSWQGQSEDFPSAGQTPPTLGPLTGCEHLSFGPLLTVAPETPQAGAPSGYTVALHIPQNEDPTGLATPDLKNAVVILPPGTVVSPSAGNGLRGCSEEQFEAHRLATASCPAASTIGTVQIVTPLLAGPLEGQVFLGRPACEPCSGSDAQEGRLVRLFVQAQGSGVTVKLVGTVAIDQTSGQLTATFAQDPQLPLEDLKLTLDGGPGAPLANASTCGVALAASSQLTPYSSETPVRQPSEPFELTGCTPPQ